MIERCMKEKILKYRSDFFIYLSLFIIVKYGISSCIDIFNLIQNNNINALVNNYVRVLQNFIFFGALLSLFITRLTAFSFAIPLAFLEIKYTFFNNYIAPLFLSQNSGMSPEYARIFFFLLIVFIFFCRSVYKKRKLTDIFLLLSMLGVLGTFSIFHIMTTKQLDYFTEKQKEIWELVYINKNIEYVCAIQKLVCEEIKDSKNIKNEFVKPYFSDFKPYMDSYSEYFYYFVALDNKIQSRILSRKPLAFVRYNNKYYYMLDDKSYTEYLEFNERIFGYLALSSHIVWIFGSLYLIHFHTKRRKRNLALSSTDKKLETNNIN